MCTYGKTYATLKEYTRQPRHKIKTRLRKRCSKSPKSKPPYNNPTHDSNLNQLNSRKGGPCTVYQDSRISVKIYETKWVSRSVFLLFINKLILTDFRWTLPFRSIKASKWLKGALFLESRFRIEFEASHVGS